MRYLRIEEDLTNAQFADIGGLPEWIGDHYDEVRLTSRLTLLVKDDCLMMKNRPLGVVEIFESGGRTDLIRGPVAIVASTEDGNLEDLVGDDTKPDTIKAELLSTIKRVKVMRIDGEYYIYNQDGVPEKHRSLHYCDLGEQDFVPQS